VLSKGCWTPVETFSGKNGKWHANNFSGSGFDVVFDGQSEGHVEWDLFGQHNINNALAAIAAARHVGVPVKYAVESLAEFKNVKRRMEVRGEVNGITVYDDFAHHPTAIASTIEGLRKKVGDARIIAILEFASATMRKGVHGDKFINALQSADEILLKKPDWDASSLGQVFSITDEIVAEVKRIAKPNDHVLIMSNRSFDGIHDKILSTLRN